MVQYLFVKYYFTTLNVGLFLEEIQQQLEEKLEQMFSDLDIEAYVQLIEVASPAYYHDIAEVEYTMPLTYEQKKAIALLINNDVYTYGVEDEEVAEVADEVLNRSYYLGKVKFRHLSLEDVILVDY